MAARARDGSTSLPVLRAEGGALALRRTGAGVVHLVGTAAGPLGGDLIEVVVRVGAGARLVLRQVAATLVLPGHREAASRISVVADVAAGARLDLQWEPTVVAALARHTGTTSLTLADDACVRVHEQVQLGRWGEDPGWWTGRLDVRRDARAVLRHQVSLGPGSPTWDGLGAARALVSTVDVPGGCDAPAVHGGAVRLPLAGGGALVTALGPDLATAHRDRAALGAAAPSRPPQSRPPV